MLLFGNSVEKTKSNRFSYNVSTVKNILKQYLDFFPFHYFFFICVLISQMYLLTVFYLKIPCIYIENYFRVSNTKKVYTRNNTTVFIPRLCSVVLIIPLSYHRLYVIYIRNSINRTNRMGVHCSRLLIVRIIVAPVCCQLLLNFYYYITL